MAKKEISSGTEKAEKLTNTTGSTKGKKRTADSSKKKSGRTKSSTSQSKKTAAVNRELKEMTAREKKKAAAESKKLEAAKIRAEKKQKKLEKKLEAKQKRLDRIAALKQARADRREARRERRDMLKHETKEARIERKKSEKQAKIEERVAKREAAAADRRAKREHRLKVRAEKRAARNDKRHAPGFGGWLAAVICLGVTTLALGTILSFGWMYTNGIQADMATAQSENLYELNSIVDNLDSNLSKAKVANTRNEQVRVLSDIAIESEMAETILERMPVGSELTQNMTSFVNKMGDSAQTMLYSVANGRKLTDSQIATIEYMYKVNRQLKDALNELASIADKNDMLALLTGDGNGIVFVTFGDIENTPVETPSEINDGPFAENIEKVNPKSLENLKEITAARAEELAQKYFADYGITGVSCTGEAMAQNIECYNISISAKDGEMWAQLSKRGGRVVEFNSYKDCTEKNFSVERCIDIAEDFLDSLGIDDMEPVWTSENGTVCNLNFAYVDDDVTVYSDLIKIKVCEERGIVTGMEALSYVLNHSDRDIPAATLSRSEAEESLNANLEVKGCRLSLIPIDGEERLAYEFNGTMDGSEYFVYVDAENGQEIQLFTVVGTAQGRALL